MDHTGRDSPGDNTLTVYEIAIEEVRDASFKLARALLARALNNGDTTTTEKECVDAHSVYDKMIHLYSRMRLDDAQRTSLLKELGLLRSSLEECEPPKGKSKPIRR
jgi:hypothetical protein